MTKSKSKKAKVGLFGIHRLNNQEKESLEKKRKKTRTAERHSDKIYSLFSKAGKINQEVKDVYKSKRKYMRKSRSKKTEYEKKMKSIIKTYKLIERDLEEITTEQTENNYNANNSLNNIRGLQKNKKTISNNEIRILLKRQFVSIYNVIHLLNDETGNIFKLTNDLPDNTGYPVKTRVRGIRGKSEYTVDEKMKTRNTEKMETLIKKFETKILDNEYEYKKRGFVNLRDKLYELINSLLRQIPEIDDTDVKEQFGNINDKDLKNNIIKYKKMTERRSQWMEREERLYLATLIYRLKYTLTLKKIDSSDTSSIKRNNKKIIDKMRRDMIF